MQQVKKLAVHQQVQQHINSKIRKFQIPLLVSLISTTQQTKSSKQCPRAYAEVLTKLVEQASPRKKCELQNKGIRREIVFTFVNNIQDTIKKNYIASYQ